MRKNICIWTIICLIILLGGPALTCYGVYHQNAMMVCLLQLMAVNPLLMIATGMMTGKMVRQRWFLPLLAVLIFCAGAWLFYAPGNGDFFWYAGGYLCLGYGTAGIVHLIQQCKTAAKL